MSVLKSTVVFYVSDVKKSQAFYDELLRASPIQASDTFVLYAIHESLSFGLWQQDAVVPPIASQTGTQGELCLFVSDLLDHYQYCLDFGVTVLQEPTDLDFATAFTVADPDGYRIRYAVAK
jgi:catechol 2,3-dioxygenase-like lactoylglutathione lyase family enzyme